MQTNRGWKPKFSTAADTRPPFNTPPETVPAIYTADEAHALIGTDKISRRTIYNALKRGDIPNMRVGRRFLIPAHTFRLWLEGRGTGGNGGGR